MTFLNPLAWVAALAAAVPLLVHLLSRRKARREVFPTVRFLQQVHRQEVRRIRLREWLLLLLRTLAVCCMALAFARPALEGSVAGAGHVPTSIVALVDRSLSMRAAGPHGTRFEEARGRMKELGELIEPGSEIQVLSFDRHPAGEFEDFIHDAARYRSLVSNLKPGYGATDLAGALREGARWLGGRHGLHRELFVFSDFQASGLDSALARGVPAALGGLDVYWIPVGSRDAANACWVRAEATRVGEGGEIDGVLRNASDESRQGILVEARSGLKLLGAARIDLPARSETPVRVPVTGLTDTDLGATLSLPHDALEEDDFTAVAFPSTRALKVLIVGPQERRVYVEAALKASPPSFEVRSSEDGSGDEPADVWVVLDPERVNSSALRAHLERGGGVLAALGNPEAARRVELALGDYTPGTVSGTEGDSAHKNFSRLRVLDPGAAGFRGLADRRGGVFSSARFFRVARVRPAPGAFSRAEFAPDLPAIVEKGHVQFFAADLAGEDGDFPLTPGFVPWLYQTLESLASRPRPVPVEVGERWVRPVPADWKGSPLRLTDPDGTVVPVELRMGGTELRTAQLMRPGLYRLDVAGKPTEALAVTTTASEADLRELGGDALRALDSKAQLIQGSLREAVLRHRHGRELWREFLIAALALFALETAVARFTVAART